MFMQGPVYFHAAQTLHNLIVKVDTVNKLRDKTLPLITTRMTQQNTHNPLQSCSS